LKELIVVFIGYLLGALPTAYLAGRWTKGADIRKMGGGNMGALNATRELGGKIGAVVLVVDVAKGAGAVLIAEALNVAPPWIYAAGFVAVLGHCWPVYLRFKGGKGAATAIGVFLALAPLPFLCILPIGLVIIWLTSNVTLGMAGGFLFLPLFLWLFHQPVSLIIFLTALIVFLGVRYLGTAKKNLKKRGWRDFLIEKNYTPWQTRRKGK
jgi:acyl phosphate:glycerol-3-phosphate acyltransferase